SVIWISLFPPASTLILMRVAPASREFSSNSFTTDAGRSTTSPAAILLATASERTWMRPMGCEVCCQWSDASFADDRRKKKWDQRLDRRADRGLESRYRKRFQPGSIASFRNASLLDIFDLLAGLVVGAELLRHRLHRGVELHKGVLDCGVGVVAGPAAVAFGHRFGGFAVGAESVVGPFVRVPSRVFDLDCQSHKVGLIVSLLVDRASAFGVALVDDEHRLFRPLATRKKFVIGPALDEHVGEHLVAAVIGTVVHPKTGGEKLPIAIISRTLQVALGVILRLGRFFFRRRCQQ